MKILLAENNPLVRSDLNKVSDQLSGSIQVEEVTDGIAALSEVRSNSYDLAILGDSIPGLGGLDILQKIKENKNITTRILIFSEYPKEQSSLKAFKMGASGYLSKFSALNVLNLALHDIASGDGYELSPMN